MKNFLSYFKLLLLPILNLVSFISCLYLSVIFFLILLISQEINGKPNEMLQEDFSVFIQKISDFPETIFSPAEKQAIDWLKRVSRNF